LTISNGLVRMTSLAVGGTGANSHLSAVLVNGTVTNTGSFTISQQRQGAPRAFCSWVVSLFPTDPVGARSRLLMPVRLVFTQFWVAQIFWSALFS